jgi:hypothetical protein
MLRVKAPPLLGARDGPALLAFAVLRRRSAAEFLLRACSRFAAMACSCAICSRVAASAMYQDLQTMTAKQWVALEPSTRSFQGSSWSQHVSLT